MTATVLSIIGRSPVAQRLDQEIAAAAACDAKVLITGESGTGKEVAARLVHDRSRRRRRPLVALNCAGVPDSLLESELFGHVRGSFTGAYRDKPGLFEAADGGTVFLDEIGEMSLRMQALMLRFLESGEVQRVGADRQSARLDVRVICATNRVLTERIASGEFREDLFYRLNVIHIIVPPLRDRRADLPDFFDHFVGEFSDRHGLSTPAFSSEARERLLAYDWPGNIRELRNVVERLIVRSRTGIVDVEDLPMELRRSAPRPVSVGHPPAEALSELVAEGLVRRMTEGRESFWQVVYEPFMARDLTRDTLRRVIVLGLEACAGRYSQLVELFRMDKDDYKKFLAVLRKHDCLVPFHQYRAGKAAGSTSVQVA
ncbi:MAG: sigma-54 dependent transcriptional regulator [Acidobacteria bacterium]|nr:sigma-54 dependent transcriptional regulator [Acidobacteriota bacterium]